LIEDYKLDQYDKAGGQAYVVKTEPKVSSEVQLIKQSIIQSTTSVPAPAPVYKPAAPAETKTDPPVNKSIDIAKYTSAERKINGVKAIIYKTEIPIAFIAQKYNITVQQLYSFNDMSPTEKFKDNDLVYVESKKPECDYNQYEVTEGETMRDIAQKFGVRLSDLVLRNGLIGGCEPVPGEIIVLRGKREFPLKFRVTGKAYPSKTSAETTPIPDFKLHKVETSETLYSISKEYNIPLDTLKKINGLKDEDIKIGQTLMVDL
jgi:LysM repeat protein